MQDKINEMLEKLSVAGFEASERTYSQRGYDAIVELDKSRVQDFAAFMYAEGFYLSFMTAVHVLPSTVVIYDFAHFDYRFRVAGVAAATEDNVVPTVVDIYSSAAWYEREIRDFFGVSFEGNPDMRPLILMEGDENFHPLLKSEEDVKQLASVRMKVDEVKLKPYDPAY